MSVARDQSFPVDPIDPPGNVTPLFQEASQPLQRQAPPSIFGPPPPDVDNPTIAPTRVKPTPPPLAPAHPPAPMAPIAPHGLSDAPSVAPPVVPAAAGPPMSYEFQPQEPTPSQDSIQDNVFVRWAALGLGAALLAALIAFLMSALFLTPVYESTTTTIVRAAPTSPFQVGADDLDIYEGFLAGEALAPTYRQLALRPRVMSAASAATGTPMEQIRANVAIRTIPRTPLIVIAYRDPNPGRAAQHADAVAQAMVSVSAQDQWVPDRELAVVEVAQVAGSPAAPNPMLNALIAFVAIAAMVGGLGFAIESNRRYAR